MPVLFVGHGSPMNAIEKNKYSEAWKAMGKKLPKPRAILCISAHWFINGTYVHGSAHPKTIHDFWGFPKELYEMKYPCRGAPELAKEVQKLVKKCRVGWDLDWGLDHGTWSVMSRMFPEAKIPVFQLSLDLTKPSEYHYQLAKELAPLREMGVLIVGSGNLVHNLGRVRFDDDSPPYDWAVEFDHLVRNLILNGDHKSLIAYEKLGKAALLSVPTPDHYWPLLYALGLQDMNDAVDFFAEGIALGNVSMRSLIIH